MPILPLEQTQLAKIEPSVEIQPWHLLCVSAGSPDALEKLLHEYAALLAGENCRANDICFTANAGRHHFEFRAAILGQNPAELKDGVSALIETKHMPGAFVGNANGDRLRLGIMFGRQASNWFVALIRALYEKESVISPYYLGVSRRTGSATGSLPTTVGLYKPEWYRETCGRAMAQYLGNRTVETHRSMGDPTG